MDESEGRHVDPLSLRCRSTPDRTAVIRAETGTAYTYRELDAGADAVAEWIANATHGTKPTVGLLLDRRCAVGPLVFGCLRAGARVALLDVQLPERDLAARFDQCDGDVVLCSSDTTTAARTIDADVIASIDESGNRAVSVLDPFDRESDTASHSSEIPIREDGELIAFTSGTTGDPKAVRLPLVTLVASAVGSALRLGVDRNDRWLVPIPTYHLGGLSPVVRCTQAGTTTVFQRSFEAVATIEAIDEYDVTCTSLVPTQLSRLLDAGWEPGGEFRFALVGGGPIPPGLLERCDERGVPVCPTYGTTETASQVATARPDEAITNPGTVGRPLAFTDVTIVDDGEQQSPPNSGEIVVEGPTVTPGYLDQDGPGATFSAHGFHTGDVGSMDATGRLWIEGRLDDRIVTGGEVVSARVVADAIRSLDGVTDAAVVGITDEEWGERVAALVEADGSLSVGAIRSNCGPLLPEYAVPKTIATTDELPRTASGTIDRSRVRERLT